MDMHNRRTFLGLAAASLLPVGLDAQTSAPRPPTELARHALTGPFEGFEVVLVELNNPPRKPGSESGPARTVIRGLSLATSHKGRCASVSTTSRNKSCRQAARSSSRPVPFTAAPVLRAPMHPRARWFS